MKNAASLYIFFCQFDPDGHQGDKVNVCYFLKIARLLFFYLVKPSYDSPHFLLKQERKHG